MWNRFRRQTHARMGLLSAMLLLAVAANVPFPSAMAATGFVSLGVDQATVIRLARPAGTVILGNPLIADASVQDTETLVLTGRSFGITNIIVLDGQGAEVLNAQLSVGMGGSNAHVVTVHRATARTSLSCTPDCEQAPMVGDDKDFFENLTAQITTRNALSLGD